MINGESIPHSNLTEPAASKSAESGIAKSPEVKVGVPTLSRESSRIELLKQLLLEEELGDLKGLRGKVSHLEDHFADRVARDLAVALQKRNDRGGVSFDELVAALQSGTESAIQKSVTEDRSRLTSALFPIMGPAIRNYVTDLFRGMVKDLNETIRNTTSLERIKWRIQAKLAGKSFSEFVLLKTRSFHVEEVYLMERDTGLLLLHVARNPADEANDEADLVSGMFTAIRSFVRDSFNKRDEESDELDSFTFGDREVLIEVGPKLVLAAVAHGVPPASAREELKSILEALHAELATPLRHFNGDTSKLEVSRPTLRSALLENRAENVSVEKGGMWRAWLFLNLVGAALVAWFITGMREQMRWDQFETQLRNTPGITITEVKPDGWWRKRLLRGMRDPLAPDPADILSQHAKISAEKVRFQLDPVFSQEPAFAAARENALKAQWTEQQKLTATQLQQTIDELKGKLAAHEQQSQTSIKALLSSLLADVPGLVISFPPGHNDKISVALSGALGNADLQTVKSRLAPLETVFKFDLNGLQHDIHGAIQHLKNNIESANVPYHDASLQKLDELVLNYLAGMVFSLDKLSTETGQSFSFEILAHPLIGQNREPNRIIESNRAQQCMEVLIAAGIHPSRLHPKLSEDLSRSGHGVSLRVIDSTPNSNSNTNSNTISPTQNQTPAP